jgi:BolA protein
MGPIENAIAEKLKQAFAPFELRIENESHRHGRPAGSESHFKVFLVASSFVGQSRVVRQRQVFETLDWELNNGVHALSMRLLTPEEWDASGEALPPPSPDCRGGSMLPS